MGGFFSCEALARLAGLLGALLVLASETGTRTKQGTWSSIMSFCGSTGDVFHFYWRQLIHDASHTFKVVSGISLWQSPYWRVAAEILLITLFTSFLAIVIAIFIGIIRRGPRWMGGETDPGYWDLQSNQEEAEHKEGYVFVANSVGDLAKLAAMQETATRAALRELFLTEEWRAHLRKRGPDPRSYNWQARERPQ